MQNVSAHLLRPGTGLKLQPAVASSQLAAGQPAAAYQAAAASAHLQLSGTMDRFTDAERKQLAFSVLIAGASVLSSSQVQQQAMQTTAGRPQIVQRGVGCGQLDLGSCSRTGTPASLQAASMRDAGHAFVASKCIGNCLCNHKVSRAVATASGCKARCQRPWRTPPARCRATALRLLAEYSRPAALKQLAQHAWAASAATMQLSNSCSSSTNSWCCRIIHSRQGETSSSQLS
ncbi:hypothetical protein COO60DRAFT_509070 [Scenedesmus sp. NREL 46B-D3]|nr:hypothetical protein COO60DRAFT_509070 [Scenedesmus sp. NREL 46B-D3]